VHAGKIEEWHDQKIEPGMDWKIAIDDHLESADLILLLISEDFLDSEYCFGVEVEKALDLFKAGKVHVVPILLKPCLWEDSRFSNLQIIPRDANPITSSPSREEAFVKVASELRKLVSGSPPSAKQTSESALTSALPSSLYLVREQIRSYAEIYERIRQRMRASDDRTRRMEQVFQQMRAIANAAYPLLDELAKSPKPGERLAAVAILQVFANAEYLPLLVSLVSAEKPFVGYQAVTALRFAVGALHPRMYPELLKAIRKAKTALISAQLGFHTDHHDRHTVLDQAERDLIATMSSISTYNQ
jgi:hypothetical protein